jgi:hypothetical protein
MEEKAIAINAHLVAQGLKDGASATKVITDVSGEHTVSKTVGGIDVSGALNN